LKSEKELNDISKEVVWIGGKGVSRAVVWIEGKGVSRAVVWFGV
jgi:hypothetical protein